VDEVFKALADESRRKLLDRLFKRNGQTLGELCEHLTMTRFGVMKHLRVLEAAHLITTRRVGREKLHFLNPVPIRLIHDRWVSKYSAPIAAAMSQLKSQLEEPMSDAKLLQVYEIYIRTTPEKLWQGLIDPALTRKYFFGTAYQSPPVTGSPYVSAMPDGSVAVDGMIIEADPPRKLVQTWHVCYDPEMAKELSRVTWLIEQRGTSCKLTATHELESAPLTAKHVGNEGWIVILSGLKTLLETGETLEIAPAA
jgi:DNA-binding transcriptional ArsR family regulator